MSRLYVRIMKHTGRAGQAMTEYALILSAVAVAAFLTYQSLGTTIATLLDTVVTDL